MKASEFYSYSNPKFAELREPARRVVAAYQQAARNLDSIQEWLWNTGLVHTSRHIHDLAHNQPKHFDRFGDGLHELHLPVEYPATSEFDLSLLETAGDAFSQVAQTFESVSKALWDFFAVTDKAEFKALALQAEELMAITSAENTAVLEMWTMYDEATSASSFDNWVEGLK